jgi:murein DD-endopeptidase
MKRLFFFVAFIATVNNTSAQTDQQVLNIQVPSILELLTIDGKLTAYYELNLRNSSNDTLNLKKVSIIDINDNSILFISQEKDLQSRYAKINAVSRDTNLQMLPGTASTIYIELLLPANNIKKSAHLIGFEIGGRGNARFVTIQSSPTEYSSITKLVLSTPLKDGNWAAVYEPSWERGHRRVQYKVNGKARIPGRYAIDFIKIDSSGKYANGDENIIKNWIGYGADVLSVADGTVSSIKNDFTESPTLSEHPNYSSEMATGNYISIKIGNKQFAFYEHLQPNSIKVKVGQRIKKGEVIASLGFTGQTTGPHLHFHIADKDSPLEAEGIPFVFDSFEVLGFYKDFGDFGKTPWEPLTKLTQTIRRRERPAPNTIISFRKTKQLLTNKR